MDLHVMLFQDPSQIRQAGEKIQDRLHLGNGVSA